MAIRKTYGVAHLTEWLCLLKVDRMTIPVHFSGGHITGYGVTPAEYSTENAAMQAIIENSEPYKRGMIFLLRQTGQADPKPVRKKAASLATDEKNGGDEKNESSTLPAAEPAGVAASSLAAGQQGTMAEPAKTGGADKDLDVVAVACVEDAAAYLREHYGVAARDVRSKAGVERVAAEKGVQFRYEA